MKEQEDGVGGGLCRVEVGVVVVEWKPSHR